MEHIKDADQDLEVESNLARTPVIAGSSVEFLQHCQQVISDGESFKGILKRFVSLLSDYFGLSHAVYILDIEEGAEGEARRGSVRFPSVKILEEDVIQKITPLAKAMLLKDDEVALGINSVKVAQQDYLFAIFSDPSGDNGFLFWKQPPLTVKPPLLRQLKDQSGSLQPILEFVTKLTQQSCRWFRRLDKTQALLYEDEVTGLYNYRYLDVAIDGELKRLHRFHAPFSLLFIDLDDFKSVNDSFGHLTGSNILKQVGAVIKLAVRDVDNVIRYGGDEFVVVLIGANSRQAIQAAERVRSRLQGTAFKSDNREAIRVTASIGVASCPEHGRDKTTILKMADETMYLSKKNGKNCVMIVSPAQVSMQSSNETKS